MITFYVNSLYKRNFNTVLHLYNYIYFQFIVGPCSDVKTRTTKPLIPCLAISNLYLICQLCTLRDAAVKFCLHCKSFLGECCTKSHCSIIPWSKHTVLSLPNAFHYSFNLSNQLYLYCVQCKLLLWNVDLVQVHLNKNHYIETLDCVYEELTKDLKKLQSETPQSIKECFRLIKFKPIRINANGRTNESGVEILYSRSGRPYSTTDDVINSRRHFGDESEFGQMYLHYWNAIMSNQEAEMMERFIKFLNNSVSAVLSCQNRDSLLIFAPMLIHSIKNPECFANSLGYRSSQEKKDR